MTFHAGPVPAGTSLYIPFTTYAGSTGASATCTGLAVTDVEIYKNGSTTQRASDAGIALLDTDGIDFDGITGLHGFSIDLSDNTDSGFYAVGSWYWVVVSAITVDSQTVTFLAATFRIAPEESLTGHPKTDVGGWLGTAVATPTVSGVPEVDITHLLGTAWLTPGTAGTPDVNLTTTALGAIWNRLTSSMSVAGSIGKKLADWVVGTIDTYTGNTPQTGDSYARLGAPSGASVAADIAAVPTAAQNAAAVEAAILNEGDATALLAAIAAKVEEFLINEGDATATIAAIAAACNAAVAAGTVGTNAATAATQATSAASSASTVNTKIGTPVVSVSADIAAVKAETALTVADTNELQADWADGGRLDSILDARASQTSVNTIGTDITTLLGRVTSNVYTMWTNLIAMISGSGGTAAFTTTAMANAPAGGGGGGSGDATLANQELILDAIDSLGTDQLAAIEVDAGAISGFPETLTIGDSYTSDTGQIKIVITDSAGDPLTSFGSLDIADADIEFKAFRPNDSAIIVGECVFVDATPTEAYVLLTLYSSETAKGKAEFTYEGRLKFIWYGASSSDTDDDVQKTYKTTPFKFLANP